MPTNSRIYFVRILLLVSLALPAPLASQTQSGEWHRYKIEAGNFSAVFPDDPKESVSDDKDGPVSHTLLSLSGSTAFTVVYVNSVPEQTVDEPNFKTYRDNVLKSLSMCTVAAEAQAAPPISGYIGHFYRMDCAYPETKLTFVGNLYWGRHFAYAVLAMFPPAASDPPTVRTFVDSFSIIDSTK